ncbi:Filament-like plant protein 4 [Hibiscus syriacus]|uniref:Filament-like plant protein 4 n=1 Tax=Hibiscus syriacus TaxID=106335 RepID=A0A6A2YRS2_HIBSY|nr:filament-like plant protein 4 [Hibiscus syriacus]XP_039024523.1 filament-like plant protein 4 [Hibiscus syriacus]XP_039024524.1 filament-like plant protein 4 [Hibiscus syriacus]XP_039024525.1 filament-like plant protein 4 [Hibiscus syriacus]KAE8682141.1 Filament-like plant protein 4 [Hibiscus syriacus]
MDRRWPWKKKSSDKASVAAAAAATLASVASQGDQDTFKKTKYVQVTVESYSHLSGLENRVKTYEEQVQSLEDEIKDLNEKLSEAISEISAKEDLVKQHTKVAEEAVWGWEKAEAEALALKNNLESIMLSKLAAEDKASHLDDALKECMLQIRNLNEEHKQTLQDVVISKDKQCEKIKFELEAKIANLDQQFLKCEDENAAISRSLQEHSSMLIKMGEEKSQAEAEIGLLKANIEYCEREINSLKYELHVASKELEIRNEEKNMSMRSAEVANKQHMEGVKKIAKLESECQRLRGLVRKKLPGPAALAQMKLEVESLGRDYGDSRLKRSPSRPSTPHLSTATDFSLDNTQKFLKENELLAERLLAAEEETKMLKEALAKRNSELVASRNLCAKTSSKLQAFEAQLAITNQRRSPSKTIVQLPAEVHSNQNASSPPSLNSLSEDGNDDDKSCVESWATALIPELSQFKMENNTEKSNRTENAKHLDLMDDFLEMEKFACSSNDSTGNGAVTITDCTHNKISDIVNGDASRDISCKELHSEKRHDSFLPESEADQSPVLKLRTKLSSMLESISKDADMQKILEDIKHAVDDTYDSLRKHSINCSVIADEKIAMSTGDKVTSEPLQIISEELADAISQIHDFILFLGREATAVDDISSDGNGLSHKIEEFSVTYNKVFCSIASLNDFVFDLSTVLAKAGELRFNVLGYKGNEVEINSPHCIDKVALPENMVTQRDSSGGRYQNGCSHILSPTSNPGVPDNGYESKQSGKFSSEELEELKLEKEKMATDLARSTENLEITKSQLHETEQLLAEARSQLASAQNSNSLAETQLKCMVESYKSLERRAEELETEVNFLRGKIETLDNELQDEKRNHQDALARCKEVEALLQRNENCSVCASAADNDLKNKQEKELAAAAEKLAQCQETIFLLGKQLKSLHPTTDTMGSPYKEWKRNGESLSEGESMTSGINLKDLDQAETGNGSSITGAESPMPMESYNTPCSTSDTEANLSTLRIKSKNAKHRSCVSSSSFSYSDSDPTPGKQSRGFSRFFSSKGKNGQ